MSINNIVDGRVLINGTQVPATSWSVEVNAFSLTSSIDATITTASARAFKALPDFFALAQTVRPLPIAIRLAFGPSGSPSKPMQLETGFVDQIEYSLRERTIHFVSRGTASLFEDVQIVAPVLKNSGGSAVIQQIFKSRGVPLTIVAPSPQYSGKTGDTDTFSQTMRGRSEWEEMQAIATADGFRLTVHNGKGAYGPFGTSADPTLAYRWGAPVNGVGLLELDLKHAARRAHNIKVVLRSYQPRSKRSISATYGNASAQDGETIQLAARAGRTSLQLKQEAQAAYNDIAKREFLAYLTVVPDRALLQTIAENGSNFNIQLGGDIPASAKRIYEARSVRLEFTNASHARELPLRAKIIAGTVQPVQDGGFVS